MSKAEQPEEQKDIPPAGDTAPAEGAEARSEKHNDGARGFPVDSTHVKLFLWFFCAIFYCECVLRMVTGSPMGEGLLFIALFGAVFALFFTAVCTLAPKAAAFVLALVFLGLLTTIYVVQMFYFFMFKTFLTVFSIFNGTDALQFAGNIQGTLANTWQWVLLMLVPTILFAIFGYRRKHGRSWKGALLLAVFAVAVQFAAVCTLNAFGTGYFTPYDYYYRNPSLNQSVDKLGLLTTFRLDAQRHFIPIEESTVAATEAAVPTAVPTPAPTPQATAQAAEVPEEPTQTPEPEYGYNVLDIDFAQLAEGTDDATLSEMDLYFGSVEPTKQNDHTGMLEGYNLITITAESLAPYAIDEELTPTLYKMANSGFVYEDFYCPEWPVSTSDGEYVNCLGLIPKPGVWSLYLSGKWGNYLPFALGNQFREQGYNTFAYHNNTWNYYNRDYSHPNMGYDYKGLGHGLDVEEIWPESDEEMIDLTTEELISNQPFHAYYVTVSGHMIYSWGGNAMSRKHRDAVEDLELSEAAKAYLACNMELDKAMELLLQRLEEAGIADKTLIVISADHPPYGLEKSQVSELLGHEVERTFEYNRNTLIMYCEGMETEVVERPVSALDILPTLSNLYGLPYDSRLLIGRDAFSETEPLAILSDRSWVTDKAMFNSNTGEVTGLNGNTVDQAYVDNINQVIAEKFKYSPQILDTDYYAHVFPERAEEHAAQKEEQ